MNVEAIKSALSQSNFAMLKAMTRLQGIDLALGKQLNQAVERNNAVLADCHSAGAVLADSLGAGAQMNSLSPIADSQAAPLVAVPERVADPVEVDRGQGCLPRSDRD